MEDIVKAPSGLLYQGFDWVLALSKLFFILTIGVKNKKIKNYMGDSGIDANNQ